MAVLINFKICDNCDACNAINVCPTKAFCWNQDKKTLEILESKCIDCGLCANSPESCQVGAIKFAKNQEELEKIKKEIEDDKRTINDLMVDRYGAQPINMPFYCKENEIDKVLTTPKLCMVEVYQEDTIECLIKSIPVKELMNAIDEKVVYRKLEIETNKIIEKYNIKELPSLLFFRNGNLVGKVEGYRDESQKEELFEELKSFILKDTLKRSTN